jgi:hypothetical protein
MKENLKLIRGSVLLGIVGLFLILDISFVSAARVKAGVNLFKTLHSFLKSPTGDIKNLPEIYKLNIQRFFTSTRTELALSIRSQDQKIVLCAVNEKGEVLLPIALPEVSADFAKTILKPRNVRLSVDQYLNWVFDSLPKGTIQAELKEQLADYLTTFYIRILERMNYVRRENPFGHLVVVSHGRPYFVDSFYFTNDAIEKPMVFHMRILKPRKNTAQIETREARELEDEISAAADTLRAFLDPRIISSRIINSPKPDKLHDMPEI